MVTWKTDKGCEAEIKADIGEVGYDRMGLEVVKEHVQWSFVISGGESLGSATGELGITQIMKGIHMRLKNKDDYWENPNID